MNQHKIIITDGVITILFNQYTFEPGSTTLGDGINSGEYGYRNHEHEIEFGSESNWYCHTCLTFWDKYTDDLYAETKLDLEIQEEEYRAERQAEYDAENNSGGFSGDNYYNGFGDY